MIERIQLFAQTPYENRLQGLRGAFNNRKSDPMDTTMILGFLAAVAVVVFTVLAVKHIRMRRSGRLAPRHPSNLFSQAMKKMGVGWTDRILMRWLARSMHMQQPTLMFFSPVLYERYARRSAEGIAVKSLRNHACRRVAEIAEMAFQPRRVGTAPNNA